MELRPQISFEQYEAVIGILSASKLKAVQGNSWLNYFSLIVTCLVVGLTPQLFPLRIPAMAIGVFLILVWLLCKPLAKRSRRKQLRLIYDEEQAKLNDQVLTLDASGISCDQSNGELTSHYAWDAFSTRIDMHDALLFLPSPNSFVRVPTAALTISDRELILEWSSHIPMKSMG